jgi:type VI secretion system (T6SS) effector TldE1-like protein
MSWTYQVASGDLLNPRGQFVETGYSGHGMDVDVVADEDQPDMGPIPSGAWTIEDAIKDDPKLGILVIPLTPQPNTNTFGRSAFFIHGDEIGHVGQELASHGCIILSHATRLLIVQSTDKNLMVV